MSAPNWFYTTGVHVLPGGHAAQRLAGPVKPLVYVAGPYTTPDPAENTHVAVHAATKLLDTGLVAPYVPHLSMLWQAITPRDYEVWLSLDFEIIRRCDALLRLPGESAGADREVGFARAQKIPVFFGVDPVVKWALGYVVDDGAPVPRSTVSRTWNAAVLEAERIA